MKTFYYLCGTEVVLREQVVDLIREKVAASPQDVVVVSAEAVGARVWDEVLAYSETAKRRLVIVRDAEALTYWDPFWTLTLAMKTKDAPVVTAVFVSAESSFNETPPCKRQHNAKPVERKARGKKTILVCPDCEAIKAKIIAMSGGLYVEISRPSEDAAVKVVTGSFDDSWPGWAIARPDQARFLLNYVGWDLAAARDACKRATALGLPLTERAVKAMAVRGVAEEFIEALTRLDRTSAVDAARHLTVEEGRRVLLSLERRLDILTRLNRTLHQVESARGITTQLGIHYAVVNALRPYAKHYDTIRVERDSVALLQADAALASGEGVGALELLALQW